MTEGVSLADIAAVTDRNNGWGNGMWGMEWLFALLLLPSITNGGFFGNNGRGESVTEAGLCNAMNFNNLENAVGRLNDQQNQIAMQTQRDLCTGFANVVAAVNQSRFENQNCCCETQKQLLENRYLAEKNTADTNATIIAQVQSVKDLLCQQEAARKDARIWQLELNQAMCGVVRYPNQTTFNAGYNPFFGCGNGCGCGNI